MVNTSKGLRWTRNEDGVLLSGLARHGNNWDAICQHPGLGRFSGEQCQARYSRMPFQNAYVLPPDQQLKGGSFDDDEQRALIELMKKFPPTGEQKRQDWSAMITYDATLTPRTLPGRDAKSLGQSWGNACQGKKHYMGGALRAHMHGGKVPRSGQEAVEGCGGGCRGERA
eukprot:COSAG04_NODE_244_length_18980_cov_6.382501_9_plen_170_part_00